MIFGRLLTSKGQIIGVLLHSYVGNQLFSFLVVYTGQNLPNFGQVSKVTLNNTMVYVHCNDSIVISRLPFYQKNCHFSTSCVEKIFEYSLVNQKNIRILKIAIR